jgi:hypothetical protein
VSNRRWYVVTCCLASGWLVLGAIAWLKTYDRNVTASEPSKKQGTQALAPVLPAAGPARAPTVERAAYVRPVTADPATPPVAPNRSEDFARLIADVVKEPRDAAWARGVEKGLADALRDPKHDLGPITINNIQCASTRCSFDASAPTFQGASKLVEKLTRIGNDFGLARGRIWRAPPSDGPIVVKAVIAREGFRVDGSEKPLKAK